VPDAGFNESSEAACDGGAVTVRCAGTTLAESSANDSTLRKDCCSNAGEFVMTQAGLRTNQDQSPVVKLTFARRMRGRDIDEKHRASTPPKLLFDLTFVVAIAGAASQLRHGLAEHHFVEAIYHP
jgi:hypothetical protein